MDAQAKGLSRVSKLDDSTIGVSSRGLDEIAAENGGFELDPQDRTADVAKRPVRQRRDREPSGPGA
jgi:hypothetical protein